MSNYQEINEFLISHCQSRHYQIVKMTHEVNEQ